MPCTSYIQNQNYHLLDQMQKTVNQVPCLEKQINIKSNTFWKSEPSPFIFFCSNTELLISEDKCICLHMYLS